MLCTHYPPYKTNDPDLWNCKAGNGCIALHYSVHFLRIFSFISFSYESEGIGARSVNHIRSYTVDWVRPVAYNDMAPSSMPMFSGAGRVDVKTGWWPDRSYENDMKEKIRKKWTE